MPPEGNRLTAAEVLARLAAAYGDPIGPTPRDPLNELIRTVLSQHTADVNTDRAFARLRQAFASWEAVAVAEPVAIAAAIRAAGLAQIKAPRIKAILDTIHRERGALDLRWLASLPDAEAVAWLRRLPGVGPKTAACVMLFALGRPVLPVDTHVHRVARRLGLIDGRVTADQAHELLGALLPSDAQSVYAFHMGLVQHGRRVCRAQRPRCGDCALADRCPSFGAA